METTNKDSGDILQEFEARISGLVHLAHPKATEEFQEKLAAQYLINENKNQDI